MFAMLRKLGLITAGALALAIGAGSASAASLTLGGSGWVATWDSSLDDAVGSQVSLSVDGETANSVTIEKFAVFADAVQSDGTIPPISITFQATRTNAVHTCRFPVRSSIQAGWKLPLASAASPAVSPAHQDKPSGAPLGKSKMNHRAAAVGPEAA